MQKRVQNIKLGISALRDGFRYSRKSLSVWMHENFSEDFIENMKILLGFAYVLALVGFCYVGLVSAYMLFA